MAKKTVIDNATVKQKKKARRAVLGYIVDRRSISSPQKIKVWMPTNGDFAPFNRLFQIKKGHIPTPAPETENDKNENSQTTEEKKNQ